jgi:hypothetical protein
VLNSGVFFFFFFFSFNRSFSGMRPIVMPHARVQRAVVAGPPLHFIPELANALVPQVVPVAAVAAVAALGPPVPPPPPPPPQPPVVFAIPAPPPPPAAVKKGELELPAHIEGPYLEYVPKGDPVVLSVATSTFPVMTIPFGGLVVSRSHLNKPIKQAYEDPTLLEQLRDVDARELMMYVKDVKWRDAMKAALIHGSISFVVEIFSFFLKKCFYN